MMAAQREAVIFDRQEHRDRARHKKELIAALALTALVETTCPAPCYAQATTVYSFDSSNRIIQAISSTGAGVQYQYDAAGNTVAVNAISPQALTQGTGDTVTFSTAGEAALLSITINPGQPVVLSESSLLTFPSNAAVTVNVYDSTGSLAASFNAATSGSIDLSGLSPGTYSIVVVPASGATGSLQLALSAGTGGSGSGGESDGPIPIWALVALGAGLLGIGRRAENRRQRAA
jgi:YD repeat-containing protein